MRMSKEKQKQSIIAGGIISSAGIFIAKLLAIIYVVPYNDMIYSADGSLKFFYGQASNFYAFVLSIATAGIPFAIAVLISRSITREDYKTALMIRKLSIHLMTVIGIISALLLVLLATPISKYIVTPIGLGPAGITNMRNVMIIVATALIFVPILSALRGFYQGLKQLNVFALSQVIEQLTNVIVLLVGSAVCVYVLNMDRIWAVYFGVISTTIAAIVGIIQLKMRDKTELKKIRKLAKEQELDTHYEKKDLLKEIIMISLPYLMVSVLGYSDSIINQIFMTNGLSNFGYAQETAGIIAGVINYDVQKLIAIPMILAPGFSAAIIPYITSALTNGNLKVVRKNILDCVDSVLYIGIPLCFALAIFAGPILALMFGFDNLDIKAPILIWYCLECMGTIISTVCTSLMMATGARRKSIFHLALLFIIKVVLVFPMISTLGYIGAVLSSIIAFSVCTSLNMIHLKKAFNISWLYTFRKTILIVISCIGIFLIHVIFVRIGFFAVNSRLLIFIQLAISGSVAFLVYIALSHFFQLPQSILHIDIVDRLKGIVKRASR